MEVCVRGHYVCSHTEFHSTLHLKQSCVCARVYLPYNKSRCVSQKVFSSQHWRPISVTIDLSQLSKTVDRNSKWHNQTLNCICIFFFLVYVSNCRELSGLNGHRIQLNVTLWPCLNNVSAAGINGVIVCPPKYYQMHIS